MIRFPNPITPPTGDIIIRRVRRNNAPTLFMLGTALGPDQYALFDLDEAIHLALTVGEREQLGVWLRDGEDCTLLEDFRDGLLPKFLM